LIVVIHSANIVAEETNLHSRFKSIATITKQKLITVCDRFERLFAKECMSPNSYLLMLGFFIEITVDSSPLSF